MTDLLSADQVTQIRQAMDDIAETFAFPITLTKTTYTPGAFQSAPSTVEFTLTAIRDYGSSSETDGQYRNQFGPTNSGEYDLYISWTTLENESLIDGSNRPLIDNNDLITMEGEIYEILIFGGVADMTKKPAFLQIRVKRRFEDPDGASAI